jgi:thiol-disulfide isomerase/thioredoxin
MKPRLANRLSSLAVFLFFSSALVGATRLFAAETGGSVTNSVLDADQAWRELTRARRPPMPPATWRTNAPGAEEVRAFEDRKRELIAVAIEKAKEFQKRFPSDSRSATAAQIETSLARVAEQLADTRRAEALAVSAERRAAVSNDPAEAAFQEKLRDVQRLAMARQSEGQAAAYAELEKGVRALLKEYPKREELYTLLLSAAGARGPEDERRLLQEIADNPDAGAAAIRAKGMLARFDALDKPVEISFTAVDGRTVNLAAMKGKVVLVDFWATWCGPCIAELPHVKAVYEKLHARGFEIIGISLDQDKDALVGFVEKQGMSWPQFFDGKGWENELAQRFGINSIPTLWLVDKKGVLRDIEARGNLQDKVERLLNE